jgi:hypothetical protein
MSNGFPYRGPMVSPIVALHYPWGDGFNKLDSRLSTSLNVNLNFSPMVVLKKIFKLIYFQYKYNSFTHYGTTRAPEIMILENLILDYVRKLPCKSALF